jgi:hypothetical protein
MSVIKGGNAPYITRDIWQYFYQTYVYTTEIRIYKQMSVKFVFITQATGREHFFLKVENLKDMQGRS